MATEQDSAVLTGERISLLFVLGSRLVSGTPSRDSAAFVGLIGGLSVR